MMPQKKSSTFIYEGNWINFGFVKFPMLMNRLASKSMAWQIKWPSQMGSEFINMQWTCGLLFEIYENWNKSSKLRNNHFMSEI